jgi:hypothetical protein
MMGIKEREFRPLPDDLSLDSLAPRWFVEAHLSDLFEEADIRHQKDAEDLQEMEDARFGDEGSVHNLPTAQDEDLLRSNSTSEDWISRGGAQDRSFKGTSWRERTADTRASRTDPDATPMRWSENARKLGYQTNYVIDGGKARVILSVLVTPGEVGENRPMLDLLFRTAFRWKIRPHHVTADGKYGTVENIKAVEESGIRAYLALHEAGGRVGFFRKSAFTYDAEKDLYICPTGETLRALGDAKDIRSRGKVVTYRARGSVCAECSLKPRCTTNKNGRSLRRGPKDEYIDLVRTYMQTEPYQKAIRKRKVWIEPLFAEGKLWHGMRRFRMRTLEKVNTEALMMATGQNIKRLLAFGRRGPEKLAQAVALRPPVRLRLDLARRRFRDHRRERRVDPTLFNMGGELKTLVPRLVGQTAEAILRKGGLTPGGRQWDEPSFFRVLKERRGAEEVAFARRVLEWARSKGMEIGWGKGQYDGAFTPELHHGGTRYKFVRLYTDGSVTILFEYLLYQPPFDDESLRLELLGRLNEALGTSIPAEKITGRPNIDLGLLRSDAVMARFVKTLDWVVEKTRES